MASTTTTTMAAGASLAGLPRPRPASAPVAGAAPPGRKPQPGLLVPPSSTLLGTPPSWAEWPAQARVHTLRYADGTAATLLGGHTLRRRQVTAAMYPTVFAADGRVVAKEVVWVPPKEREARAAITIQKHARGRSTRQTA